MELYDADQIVLSRKNPGHVMIELSVCWLSDDSIGIEMPYYLKALRNLVRTSETQQKPISNRWQVKEKVKYHHEAYSTIIRSRLRRPNNR